MTDRPLTRRFDAACHSAKTLGELHLEWSAFQHEIDQLTDAEREPLRDIFVKHRDRILGKKVPA